MSGRANFYNLWVLGHIGVFQIRFKIYSVTSSVLPSGHPLTLPPRALLASAAPLSSSTPNPPGGPRQLPRLLATSLLPSIAQPRAWAARFLRSSRGERNGRLLHRGIKRLLTQWLPLRFPHAHLCTNKTRTPDLEKHRSSARSFPSIEMQSYSRAKAVRPAIASWPTHAAVPQAGPLVLSSQPAPPPTRAWASSPPPARGAPRPSRPRSSPPRPRLLRGRHWWRPAPEGAHWPGGESLTRRIPPPAGLRGNFLIIVTPKAETPGVRPESLSQSESRAAVQRLPRCVGWGPGFPGGGPRAAALGAAAAFHGARLSARGARRGCCGCGASSPTRGRASAVPAGHPRPCARATLACWGARPPIQRTPRARKGRKLR